MQMCMAVTQTFHFFSILGKMVVTPTADPNNPSEEFEGLETRAVEVLGQFSLESDDPANYTDRFTFMQQRREWPGKRYPPGADLEEDPYGRVSQLIAAQQPQPQGATGGPVPFTSGAGTSSAPSLPTPQENKALLDMKKGLIQYHHDLVRMCSKAGIPDVCAHYKETRVDNILKGLSSDDLSCKICKKGYSNTYHLRNHIKMKHLKKTPFYCSICKKYFTDQSTLNDHNRKHDPDAKKYKCMQCEREFFSKSKLKAHEPMHSGPTFVCQYCKKKTFFYKAGVKEHEKGCDDNPNKPPKPKCRLCGKEFTVRRSLKRHMDSAHEGAPISNWGTKVHGLCAAGW